MEVKKLEKKKKQKYSLSFLFFFFFFFSPPFFETIPPPITTISPGGDAPLTEMTVTLATSSTRFSAALNAAGKISVAGAVRSAGGAGDDSGPAPFLTRVGAFDVDLALEGIVLLTRQTDQPGIIAAVSAVLGEAGINISFMTVSRTGRGRDAVMALGVDSQPDADLLAKITGLAGITEFALVKED